MTWDRTFLSNLKQHFRTAIVEDWIWAKKGGYGEGIIGFNHKDHIFWAVLAKVGFLELVFLQSWKLSFLVKGHLALIQGNEREDDCHKVGVWERERHGSSSNTACRGSIQGHLTLDRQGCGWSFSVKTIYNRFLFPISVNCVSQNISGIYFFFHSFCFRNAEIFF